MPMHAGAGRFARTALTLATAAALALGAQATPAMAAEPVDVLISFDGTHFTASPGGGIFDGVGKLVPGDSLTSAFWIRNPTALPAALRVSMRDLIIPSREFAGGVSLISWDSGTDTTREKTLGGLASCDILVPSQEIAPGGTMKVQLRFVMGDMDGLVGQDQSVSLDLIVAMRDGQAGPFPASACDDDGLLIPSTGSRPGTMARTGADLPVPLIVSAALLVGVGISLIAGGRRRRDEESA